MLYKNDGIRKDAVIFAVYRCSSSHSAAICANHATYAITKSIDTSSVAPCECGEKEESEFGDRAYGAGVGYGLKNETHYRFPAVERGDRDVRVYTFFNPTQYDRCEVADLTIWDMPCEEKYIEFYDTEGNRLPATISAPVAGFWNHRSHRCAVKVSVPAFGYSSVIVRIGKDEHISDIPVTNLNAMTSFLEFISNNMLMVVVLPLGLGMIVMYVGVVITTKKSVQNSATEKEKDSDGAEN